MEGDATKEISVGELQGEVRLMCVGFAQSFLREFIAGRGGSR